MKRIERLYAVNAAVRRAAPRPVSAAQLAEEFEVSRRTIERDLDSLRKAGVPLYSERGRSGGQRTLENPDRVLLSLSVAEVSSLVLALSAAGDDLPFSETGRAVVKQLIDASPEATRVGIDELRCRVRTLVEPAEAVTPRVRRVLETGVLEQRVLNLEYVDRNAKRSKRSVDPVGFLNDQVQWSLIGWCHTRQAGRLFRFDRIQSARLTSRSSQARDVDEVLGWVPRDTVLP